MELRGNTSRYGALAIALHWISAAAVLVLLVVGLAATRASEATAAALLRLHVPLGLLVLVLTIGRLVWRRFDRRPADPPGPRLQMRAAHVTHALLYALLILMGFSGIALMALSGAGPILFGGAPLPLPRFGHYAPMAAHALAALALVVLLIFHLAGALYHQFYRRDGLLLRMVPARPDDC